MTPLLEQQPSLDADTIAVLKFRLRRGKSKPVATYSILAITGLAYFFSQIDLVPVRNVSTQFRDIPSV